jgi:hypothetical protein
MTYALARGLEAEDMPAVRQIVRDAAKDGYRFSALVLGIVLSPQFQMKQQPQQVAATTAMAASPTQ